MIKYFGKVSKVLSTLYVRVVAFLGEVISVPILARLSINVLCESCCDAI